MIRETERERRERRKCVGKRKVAKSSLAGSVTIFDKELWPIRFNVDYSGERVDFFRSIQGSRLLIT